MAAKALLGSAIINDEMNSDARKDNRTANVAESATPADTVINLGKKVCCGRLFLYKKAPALAMAFANNHSVDIHVWVLIRITNDESAHSEFANSYTRRHAG